MKCALVTLVCLVAAASAGVIQVDYEENTAYNYLEKIGRPLAEEIRRAEETNSRIVGGSPSAAGQFPHQAGLLVQYGGGQGVCGASLVSSNRLVTAAHCWFDGGNQGTSITVILGTTTFFSGGTRITTSDITMHGSWMPSLARNDIAMIRITSVQFTGLIRPIALPSGSQLTESFAGETATASGFGRTSDSSGIGTNQVKSHVELPVISNTVCSMSYPFLIQSSNICTSGANGRGTCGGDSGGPLTVIRNGVPILVGVTSFGSASGCQAGLPAAFARVTSFISFINQNL